MAVIEFAGRISVALFLLFAGVGLMTAVVFFFIGRKPPGPAGDDGQDGAPD